MGRATSKGVSDYDQRVTDIHVRGFLFPPYFKFDPRNLLMLEMTLQMREDDDYERMFVKSCFLTSAGGGAVTRRVMWTVLGNRNPTLIIDSK